MPKEFTRRQRARLRRQTARTIGARVFASSRRDYDRRVRQFVDFCDAHGWEPDYTNFDAVSRFFQFYVTGLGSTKLRSYKTLFEFLSAWRDHALVADLPFPHPGTPLRARLLRVINGLARKYPHTTKRTAPLCLGALRRIAARLGIRTVADLRTASPRILSIWARIITAHGCCLRPVEHAKGLRISDLGRVAGHVTLLVGSREGERKYHGTSRVCVLAVTRSVLCAGYVLRHFVKRCRRGAAAGDVLFADFVGNKPLDHCESWKAAFSRIRRLAAKVGVTVTRGNCLRAGGATDLFAIKAPRWWIKRQGGWKCDAVDIYNRPTDERRADMAKVFTTDIINAAAHVSKTRC